MWDTESSLAINPESLSDQIKPTASTNVWKATVWKDQRSTKSFRGSLANNQVSPRSIWFINLTFHFCYDILCAINKFWLQGSRARLHWFLCLKPMGDASSRDPGWPPRLFWHAFLTFQFKNVFREKGNRMLAISKKLMRTTQYLPWEPGVRGGIECWRGVQRQGMGVSANTYSHTYTHTHTQGLSWSTLTRF